MEKGVHKKPKMYETRTIDEDSSSSSKSSSYVESTNRSSTSIQINVPSAKKWYEMRQLSGFKISIFDIENEKDFFENIEIVPTPENIKDLIEATCDKKPPEKWIKTMEGKLIIDCQRYRYALSEAAVNEAFSTLLKIIDFPSEYLQMQSHEIFGRIDVAVVQTFYNAVIENK